MPAVPPTDEWLAAALLSIGDAIIATDSLDRVVWMNEAAEALTGCNPRQSQNRPLAEVLPLYDEVTELPAVPCAPAASYILRRDGVTDRPVEVSCPLNGLLLCRDLTRGRERENLRVRSERLDAIAGLAGGVAHDLNNHLTVIQGYIEELRNMPGLEDQAPVLEIAEASLAAAALTRSLMGIARRSANHPEILVLTDLVTEMSGAISRLLGNTRTLRVVADPAKAKVQADPTLLRQVLTTIAIFSREAKPAGGEFRVEASGIEVPERPVPGWNHAGPHARLLIDSGAAAGDQAISRIFEPSCTSRQVSFAHGVGLAQVYGIVAQCGGFIRAVATPGGHLSFEILLPLALDIP